MNNTLYPPEGLLSDSNHPYTLPFLKGAMEQGDILEGKVVRCDTQRRLIVDLDGWTGIIPEAECVAPFISGAGKGIALLSCVGRTVSFLVTSMVISPKGDTCFMLSRRWAQEKIMQQLCTDCLPGSVLPARVTHLDSFGAFVDIGGGVISGGHLLGGRGGNAGEIGHITVETRHGLVCSCGYPNRSSRFFATAICVAL